MGVQAAELADKEVPRLLGRDAELTVLYKVVDRARERGGALVVRGEAGVGKTSLLKAASRRAHGAETRVLAAVGVQSETDLAFSGLHRLLLPVIASHAGAGASTSGPDWLDRLPAPQRDALRSAFGLGAGSAPDRFLVGLATLGLLSEVAEERPLVCTVDDVQWLDHSSAQALAFVARRVLAEPLAIIFATRHPSDELSGLPELVVGGLQDSEALELLRSVVPGPLDQRVCERIVSETRGNPLALVELSHELSAVQLVGEFGASGYQGVSTRIEESFQRRVDDLPDETRLLLLVAAAEPLGDPLLLRRAAALLGIEPDAAEPAEAAGLIRLDVTVAFRHPLVRSAIYRMASPAERRRVHAALAEATDAVLDPDRRAWHRAQAAQGPDEEVAAELEASAGRARERGAMAAAAAFLVRAVALTPNPSERGRRAVVAAEAKLSAGVPHDALELLSIADASPLGELQSAQVDLQRAHLAFLVNRGRDAPPLLLKAAKRFEPLDPTLARDTYLDALHAAVFAGRFGEGGGLGAVAEAVRGAPAAGDPPRAVDLLLDGFALTVTDGYSVGAPVLSSALDAFVDPAVPVEHLLRWGDIACHAAQALWDERWGTICARLLALGREGGARSVLPLALTVTCGWQLQLGKLNEAAVLLEELGVVAEATGTTLPPLGAVSLAAWRGNEKDAAALMQTTREAVTARGEGVVLTFIDWRSASLYNGLGKYSEALEAASRAFSDPTNLWIECMHELVEAAARSGAHETARAAANAQSAMAKVSGTDWALGMDARSQALVAGDGDVDSLYQEALDRLARTALELELARTHLLYGEWLRRVGRRVDAREQLRTAHDMLAAMGVEGYAERAKHELQATGETVRKRSVETRDELTAQEAQIARLARDGLSNPEIGARLFISPRTVEWHLRKVFAKLDIGSRKELPRALGSVESELVPG